MNIMVFDVPAESSGALSVLNDFYDEVKYFKREDINWFFVISVPYLAPCERITVLRLPWIKKSWLLRLFFDMVLAPMLVKKYKIDLVLSLQNIIIPRTKVRQMLYVHNALPFSQTRISFMRNKLLWIRQNLIGRKIFDSVEKAGKVFVQTEWMKQACIERTGVDGRKITVIPPQINDIAQVAQEEYSNSFSSSTLFFYPASGVIFKNHEIIVEAVKTLKKKVNKSFRVVFTLNGNEGKHISSLHKAVRLNKLPIDFVGLLSRERVYQLYNESILLFPSYIESLPLPLLEAKLHHATILASDFPFSREALQGYDKACLFNAFNADELCDLMVKAMGNTLVPMNIPKLSSEADHKSLVVQIVDI